MKDLTIFLCTVIFSSAINSSLYAQSPSCEAKCLSGDCQNGYGTYRFDDCTLYEGNFKNYQLNGQGKYRYSSGEAYDGNWKDSKREGFGKTTWTNGTRHEGYWVNNIMDGQGTIWYASGEKYVGQCYDSNREGKGIHYNSSGSVTYDGYWKNNAESTSTTTTTTTPTTAEEDYSWLDFFLDSLDQADQGVPDKSGEEETDYEDYYDDYEEETVKEATPTFTGENTQGTSSGNFCSDYKAVAATAADYYKSIQGDKRSEEGELIKTTVYNTTQAIAGAEDCYIQSLLGTNYYALYGEYNSLTDAEAKFNELQGKIKSCLTDKIFENGKVKEYDNKSLSFITKYPDGFNLYGDQLDLYKDSKTGKYVVRIYISSNSWNKRVYTINSSGGSGDGVFDSNLKKLMESSRNDFKDVLGEKHVTEGFLGSFTTYDINATLPGIFDLSYSTGGFTLGTNDLDGVSYEGTDANEAKLRFEKLDEKVKKALGSAYVYTKYTATDGGTISNSYGLKNEIKEDKTPVVNVEYRYSDYSKDYSVKISIAYKGFGSIL